MFKFIKIDKLAEEKKIVYKKSEYSLDTVPLSNSEIYILVDDVQFGFDFSTGYFTQLFGYFPQLLFYEKKDIDIPISQKGILILDTKNLPFSYGESIRLKNSSEWVTFYAEDSGYVYFGKEVLTVGNNHIEFCSDCIASISSNGDLEGIWFLVNWI